MGVLSENSESDLRLQAWSVTEKATKVVRQAPPGQEVSVRGWPGEKCSVVVPTDKGAVILLFDGARVNATLFDENENSEDDASDMSTPVRSYSRQDADESFSLETRADP